MTARFTLRATAGFTLVEVLIATGIVLAALGVVLPLADGAQATFHAQGEVADMHQRLRASITLLVTDLRAARAVRPYRTGALRDDSVAGVFYRADTITVSSVPTTAPEVETTRTYYLKSDPSTMTFELMQYDGDSTDLPAVEHVVGLAFEYFGDATSTGGPLATLDAGQLTDGPWLEDASRRRYDADLLHVRQVGIHLRLESSDASTRGQTGMLFLHGGTLRTAERFVPDDDIVLEVAVRNLRRDP